MSNKLTIAGAGSGKTTYLVNQALSQKEDKVLITTYTEANEEEIKKKFIEINKSIPANVKIQTWFSFLLQHGVKPYQGSFNSLLFDKEIRGLILNDGTLGIKFNITRFGRSIPIPFKEEDEFIEHYFTSSMKIYSDRLSKFVVKSNTKSNGKVIERISNIFKYIFIDEVQDLAGYDLEIIKLLFKSNSYIELVGDPRQVTYLTHNESKNRQYKEGKIKEFVQKECKADGCVIDETTLQVSHRNNRDICAFSSQLHLRSGFTPVTPCSCTICRGYTVSDEGIYLVRPKDVDDYLSMYNPVQLRWDSRRTVNPDYKVFNFGESKGKTFDRVLIYPTDDMEKWVYDNRFTLQYTTQAKFYVAITRARFSVGIVTEYSRITAIPGVILYS